VRRLGRDGYTNILGQTRNQLDLRDQTAVNAWFKVNRPDYVFLVAGTVGGILANSTRPAEFIYDNLMIHATIIEASRRYGVKRLLYLGSACIYPRECPQPIREEYLLSGPLEPTNESYAIAKIAASRSGLLTTDGTPAASAALSPADENMSTTTIYGDSEQTCVSISRVLANATRQPRRCISSAWRSSGLTWPTSGIAVKSAYIGLDCVSGGDRGRTSRTHDAGVSHGTVRDHGRQTRSGEGGGPADCRPCIPRATLRRG